MSHRPLQPAFPTKARRAFGTVLALALALALAPIAGCGDDHDSDQPTFVLVHGALFTGDGWEPLQKELGNGNSVAFDLPGRKDGVDPRRVDLGVAAAKVCGVVAAQPGKVILVGHSQGGVVITQAASDCPDKVAGLIYVAALVPKSGETGFAALNESTNRALGSVTIPDPSAGVFRINRAGPLEKAFFQDLRAANPALADKTLAAMVDEPLGIGATRLEYDEAQFAALPKFYVATVDDGVVAFSNQKVYIERTPFNQVYELHTGHCPFLSAPKGLADILRGARDTHAVQHAAGTHHH